MIDPRFANAGAVPLVPGYGGQQIPAQYHQHHHRHHRHHKHKVRNDASPVSLDESIHKVDHSQPQYFQQNEGVAQGGGYGVPYGAGGFETGASYGAAGFYPQQQYGGTNFGYANQYQGGAYGQGQFVSGPGGPGVKHHRRHRRHHHHHNVEAANVGVDQAQAVPEQLIGQRSSSVLDNEQQQQQQQPQASASLGQVESTGDQGTHHRHHHRHHRHHHSNEHAGFEQAAQQSHAYHHHTAASADGYGHINDELIFIERGDHSPHRQEPPPGYEYKGKIEVQSIDREHTVHTQQTQGQNVSTASTGGCPPGSYPAILTPGGPACPPGSLSYQGQLYAGGAVGSFGATTGGYGAATGGYGAATGGYGAATGGYGAGTSGYNVGTVQTGTTGYGLGGSLPVNCQIVADYVFGSGSGISTSGGQSQKVETNVTTRPTVIEVWQKRGKSETHETTGSGSRPRTPVVGPSFDLDRFRNEILAAIERIISRGGPSTGTQTQIHPERPYIETEKKTEAGEVRVIVQPIQPVFYMPRQTGTTTVPQVGPAPVAQPTTSGAAQIVYVPRNVYVPVIKPVFVPRERVIVRPQVIHVARPVLVDRPVPVTQRPIIIDRERPVPVPVRSAGQAAQAGGSKVVREEYVYRDNLPVAYGGRCAEFAGGVNYGYLPSQQEHQYANSSTHETASIYQNQGAAVNINVPSQFQQSTSSSHVEVQQGGAGSFHGSYSNLADVGNAGQLNQEVLQQTFEQSTQQVQCIPVNGTGGFNGTGSFNVTNSYNGQTQVEILDAAVNPFWQKTDQTTLLRKYGRPAYQIVNQSKEVEQQMYNEIRQRTSSGGVVRSASGASFGSSSGIGAVSGGGFTQY